MSQQYRAHAAVSRAIKAGKLIRPAECSDCGQANKKIEGHHDDYSKPLSVKWLCPSCHSALHAKIGKVFKDERWVRLPLQMTKTQKRMLVKLAKKENRSMNGYLTNLIAIEYAKAK